MQHVLYEVPVPQAQFMDLSNSSLLFFFNYENRYQLKSFNADLLESLTLIYLGHDFFPIQQWAQAENFSKPIRWSGPEGLKSSLCVSLEIKDLPMFLGLKNTQVVYCSRDFPSTRFLQDFHSGNVKSMMHEIIREVVLEVIENIGQICGSDFEVKKIEERSYSDTISVLQSEVINYQGLCKQQQLVIEALREELMEKNKMLQSLNSVVNNQSVLTGKLQQVQQNIKYEKAFAKIPDVKSPPIVDDEFWKIKEEENEKSQHALNKNLWIMNLDTEISSSAPVLPGLNKLKPINFKGNKPSTKTHLEEQQEKYLKTLQDKQPMGRDGKKLPLPIPTKKTGKNTIKMHKSSEGRFSRYSGFN